MMKRLSTVAALLLASSAAQAQYQFEYNGQTIRIDPDRGTVSIPGIYDNTGERTKRPRRQDATRKPAPREAKRESGQQASPQVAPADPAGAAATPQPPSASPPPAAATATAAPVEPAKPASPSTAPTPQRLQEVAPPAPSAAPLSAPPRPAPAQAATTPAVPTPPSTDVAPAARDPNSPVGVWLTEEKEGKIRIEPCGTNLCGYAIDAKSNQNREQILINMRAGQNKVWSGRIFDPDSGSTYDSTIALKAPDSLRVQGCALGGMFCGGQTWTRVN